MLSYEILKKRYGIDNSSWVNKEGHEHKIVNLAALGNGNVSKNAGKFLDWLKMLITLPVGIKERKILSTCAGKNFC